MKNLISQIGENLSFVLECLGIFAGLFVLALLFERLVMKTAKARQHAFSILHRHILGDGRHSHVH